MYVCFFTVQCIYNFDIANQSSFKLGLPEKFEQEHHLKKIFLSKNNIDKKNIRLNKRFQPESFQITQRFITVVPVFHFGTGFHILTEEPVTKSLTNIALRGPPAQVV